MKRGTPNRTKPWKPAVRKRTAMTRHVQRAPSGRHERSERVKLEAAVAANVPPGTDFLSDPCIVCSEPVDVELQIFTAEGGPYCKGCAPPLESA